jgi:hypothetical protein
MVFKAVFGHLEGRCEVKNRPAMLNGNHPPDGKTPPIARTIHIVNNWRAHIATTEKIRVQGMRTPPFNGVMRCRQCLTEHLPTENLRAAYVAALAPEYIIFDALKLQEMKQVL